MKAEVSFWACVLLTLIVSHTCAQIEVRNFLLGGMLPSRELHGDTGQPVKWRVAAEAAIRQWAEKQLRVRALLAGDSAAFDRQLTPEEKRQIEAETAPLIARSRAESSLREWVQSGGLLNYLLAPVALVWSLRLAWSERSKAYRIGAGVCAVLAGASTYLMLHRGYFASLGW